MKRTLFALIALIALTSVFVSVVSDAQNKPTVSSTTTKPKPSPPVKPGTLVLKLTDFVDNAPAQQIVSVEFALFQNNEIVNGHDWSVVSGSAEGEYVYVKNLQPGTYDIHLRGGVNARGNNPVCPIHINGLVVKPGPAYTQLDKEVKLTKGDTLIEDFPPTVLPVPAMTVAEELQKLQDQIDELKKANAELKKQIEELKKK